MKYFSGFKWAVPTAFSDAVSLCRFEEGDILYDTKKAYTGGWGSASKHIEYSMQVRFPARAAGGVIDRGSGIFDRNWNSEVRIDLYKRLNKVGDGQIPTTQGRLYSALWKGDLAILEMDAEKPQIPLLVQAVTRSLDQAADKAKELANGFPVFVMPRDLSNSISRIKYAKVLSKLNKHLSGDPKLLMPKHAGFDNWKIIAPTLEIAFFSINGISGSQLHDLVKDAVYVPARNAKKDMFRIAAHGAIF